MRKLHSRKPKVSVSTHCASTSEDSTLDANDAAYILSNATIDYPSDSELSPTKREKIINTSMEEGLMSKRIYRKLNNIQFTLPKSRRAGLRSQSNDKDKPQPQPKEAKFMDPFNESRPSKRKVKSHRAPLQELISQSEAETSKSSRVPRRKTRSQSDTRIKRKKPIDRTTPSKRSISPSSSQRSIVSWLDRTPPPPKRPPLHDYSKQTPKTKYSSLYKTVPPLKRGQPRNSRSLSVNHGPGDKSTPTSEETKLWRRKLDLEPSKYIKQVNVPATPTLSAVSSSSCPEAARRRHASRSQEMQRAQHEISLSPTPSSPVIGASSPYRVETKSPKEIMQASLLGDSGIQLEKEDTSKGKSPRYLSVPPAGQLKQLSSTLLSSTPLNKMFTDSSADDRTDIHIPLLLGDSTEEADLQSEGPSQQQYEESVVKEVPQRTGFPMPGLDRVGAFGRIVVDQNEEPMDISDEEEKMDTSESEVDSALGSGDEGLSYWETSDSRQQHRMAEREMENRHKPVDYLKRNSTGDHQPLNRIKSPPSYAEHKKYSRIQDSRQLLQTILSDLKQLSGKYTKLSLVQSRSPSNSSIKNTTPHHNLAFNPPLSPTVQKEARRNSCGAETSPSASLDSVRLVSPLVNSSSQQNSSDAVSPTSLALRRRCLKELDAAARVCSEFSRLLRNTHSSLHSRLHEHSFQWNQILLKLNHISAICHKLEIDIMKLSNLNGK